MIEAEQKDIDRRTELVRRVMELAMPLRRLLECNRLRPVPRPRVARDERPGSRPIEVMQPLPERLREPARKLDEIEGELCALAATGGLLLVPLPAEPKPEADAERALRTRELIEIDEIDRHAFNPQHEFTAPAALVLLRMGFPICRAEWPREARLVASDFGRVLLMAGQGIEAQTRDQVPVASFLLKDLLKLDWRIWQPVKRSEWDACLEQLRQLGMKDPERFFTEPPGAD